MTIIESFLDAYMDGAPTDIIAGSGSAFVPAFIDGEGLHGSTPLYLHASFAIGGTTDCFIAGESTESNEPKGALRFRSIDQQYVLIPDNANYDYIDAFTLSFWVKPTANSNGQYRGIVVKQNVLETWIHPTGNSIGVGARIGGVYHQALSLSYARNRWYLITVTYDGQVFRVYRDGSQFYQANATGELLSNNEPWYFGRWPARGTYTDMELSQVKMWNYALTSQEIEDMYIVPARTSCIDCYIVTAEVVENTLSRRAFIQSPYGPTNPGLADSVLNLCIATDAVDNHDQRAFIVAGGEGEVVWDTRIDYDLESYVSWDTLTMVRDGTRGPAKLKLGNVEYPITRTATKLIRVLSASNPEEMESEQNCHLHAGFEITDGRDAYIVVGQGTGSVRSVFLQGAFTPATDFQYGFIMNNETRGSVGAYIEGIPVFKYVWTKYIYLNGFIETVEDSNDCFIAGLDEDRFSTRAHIVAPNPARSWRPCYVMSTVELQASERSAFINGHSTFEPTLEAYFYGHEVFEADFDSYIVAVPIISDSHNLYIQVEWPYKTWKHSYMRGRGADSTNKMCYITTEVSIEETQDAFIQGYRGREWTHLVHLVGPVPAVIAGGVGAFIVNGFPVVTKYAFIVSGPLSDTPCYIVSSGGKSVSKGAYLAA